MTLALVLFGVAFGGLVVFGVVAAIDQKARALATDEAERDVAEDVVRIRYLTTLDALSGPAQRLRLFAAASDELAQQCRRDALAGAAPLRLAFTDDSYELPLELENLTVRPGPPETWQPLDRALQRLAAINDDDDPAVHADAHERVSLAAQTLAEQLHAARVSTDLDHCWFCGDAADRLLTSSRASICEACVHACHERLQDH
jgi:hypothetical protein